MAYGAKNSPPNIFKRNFLKTDLKINQCIESHKNNLTLKLHVYAYIYVYIIYICRRKCCHHVCFYMCFVSKWILSKCGFSINYVSLYQFNMCFFLCGFLSMCIFSACLFHMCFPSMCFLSLSFLSLCVVSICWKETAPRYFSIDLKTIHLICKCVERITGRRFGW